MNDLTNVPDSELLRLAIRDASQDPETEQFELGQIYAGLVSGSEELEEVWQEETSPEQAELDLHLTGPGVVGHSTRADHLADFVSGINTAMKAIARERLGLKSHPRNLLIEGATPGSVRVVLRAQAGPAPNPKTDDNPMPGTERQATNVDSEALRTIARLFTNASDPDGQPSVLAEVRDLPPAARKAIRRSVIASRKGEWEIDGLIRQRTLGASPIAFTKDGARVLEQELKQHDYESVVRWSTGTIDGFRRSLGTFYFTPNIGERSFAVSVHDSAVLAKAAALAADEGIQVRVQIETITATDGPEKDRTTTSRLLLDIKRAEDSGKQTSMEDAETATPDQTSATKASSIAEVPTEPREELTED
ncbi:hypothetical protein [Rhodococcus qingshengii]|uniref:hypothetical protein n=1 Tax=Rhodococcus qingshengii TaxID=334542 RepID=UPI001ADFABF3|nr:hypothetical protein [Rhodococcus qingshengii]MCQ4150246.1 hypothetical protein [Rhodococcus qingshengii]